MEQDCIFCKIARKEIPARIIYESDNSIAFLDIAPATRGHTVVIPKVHFYNFLDMPVNLMKDFFLDVQKVSKLVLEKIGAKGFNLIQNNFEIAGQIVPHSHIHIIPRYENDKVPQFSKDPDQAIPEKLDEVYQFFQ
ncbi:MAG: HIT family protein [Promethearchaeota archaeon]